MLPVCHLAFFQWHKSYCVTVGNISIKSFFLSPPPVKRLACSGCRRNSACAAHLKTRMMFSASRAGCRRPGLIWPWWTTPTQPTSSSPCLHGLFRFVNTHTHTHTNFRCKMQSPVISSPIAGDFVRCFHWGATWHSGAVYTNTVFSENSQIFMRLLLTETALFPSGWIFVLLKTSPCRYLDLIPIPHRLFTSDVSFCDLWC